MKTGSVVIHKENREIYGVVTHVTIGGKIIVNSLVRSPDKFELLPTGKHVIVAGVNAPCDVYDGQELIASGTHTYCLDVIHMRQHVPVKRSDLIAWRKEYQTRDGTDCVTPFDGYLYK